MTLVVFIAALTLLPLVARATIKIGIPFLTYWIARAAMGHEAALLHAAQSVYYARDRSSASAWVRPRLAVPNAGGSAVAAAALVRDALGDRDGARLLLESLRDMNGAVVSYSARVIADRWLMIDAASRGGWTRARAIADAAVAWAPTTLFLGAVARRMLTGASGASELYLYCTWILSMRWSARPLLERALSQRTPLPKAEALMDEAPSSGGGIARAMQFHADLVGSRDASFWVASRAGAAWDAALSDAELADTLRRRAIDLGANIDALDAVRCEIEIEIAAWARDRELCLADVPDAGPILTNAALRLRSDLLEEIESTAGALARRADEQRALPSVDEWMEFDAVKRKLDKALRTGGREVRRLALPALARDLAHYAVWMFNVRKERVVANAVFQWLYVEALTVGDADTAEMHGRNARLGVR